MTAEESKKDYFRLLDYMVKNEMSDTLQNTVLGLISTIRPREMAYQALKEMLMFTKKEPDEIQMFHQANKIYNTYQQKN